MTQARIGVNATSVLSNPTGLAVASIEIVKKMLTQADNIVVYTTSRSLKSFDPQRVKLTTNLISPDHRVRGHGLRLLWCQTVLPARLLADGIEIAYSTVEEGMFWGGFRQVVTCYDIMPILYPRMYPMKRFYLKRVAPMLLRSSAAIICSSENTRRDIVSAFNLRKKPVFVVPLGIDGRKFYPRESNLARGKYALGKFIFYVGEMKPSKNLGRAIEAFSRLNLPEYKFLIAGSKDKRYYPPIARLVAKLGLEERVVFPGYVPEGDLPGLYCAADAFVSPSLYEGFGLPPLEAMACGCPVITTRCASLPEVCGDAACYVDSYNVDSMAEGIYKVVTKPGLRKHLVQKGLEQAKGFTWAKTARKVLDVLEYVAQRRVH